MSNETQGNYPTRIDLVDGKYTVIIDMNNGVFKALRYGEEWRSLTGDKMVLAMFDKIVELQEEVSRLKGGDASATSVQWHALTGRIPGDDEDMLHVCRAASRAEAVASFVEAVYENEADPEQARINVKARYGAEIFINSVVVSDAEIRDIS